MKALSAFSLTDILQQHGNIVSCVAFLLLFPLFTFYGRRCFHATFVLASILSGLFGGYLLISNVPMNPLEGACTVASIGAAAAVLSLKLPQLGKFVMGCAAGVLVTNFAYVHIANWIKYDNHGTHIAMVLSLSISMASLVLLTNVHMDRLMTTVIGGYMCMSSVDFLLHRLNGDEVKQALLWPTNFFHQASQLRGGDNYWVLISSWAGLSLVGYIFQTIDVREWGRHYWHLNMPTTKHEEEGDEDGVYWDGVIVDGYEIDCEDWDGVIDGYRRLSARPASHADTASHHSLPLIDRQLASSDETAIRYMNSDVRII
uniref:Transmembrane protein 198 n=1 Tax=Pyramimonas obovata TaxID=1411642 RepID=A0A7S0RTE3_9CHLO|mmetsp:Transcript_6083/g.12376  ORF Transcript_6083/g.12376 Transcript_6083/m.12376 type:complete len:315 (+) Transcript_6083:165-1109(+)